MLEAGIIVISLLSLTSLLSLSLSLLWYSSLALLAEDDDSDDDLEAFKARVRREADEKRAELAKKYENSSKALDSNLDDDDDDDDVSENENIKKVIHEGIDH